VEYELVKFENGAEHRGMYEYPFQIKLPDEVQQSIMIQVSERNAS